MKKIFLFVLFPAFTIFANAQNNALVLNGAYIKLNGGNSGAPIYFIINQSSASGVVRLGGGGHIISENEFNYVKWNAGLSIGTYLLPFGYGITDYLPFIINKTTSGSPAGGYMLTSTYSTASDNLPWASGVTHMNNPSGTSDVLMVPDRWWIIDASSYTTTKPNADLTFTYRDPAEYAAPNTINESNLQAQRWNSILGMWGDWGPAGVQSGSQVAVTGVAGTDLHRSWVLADKVSFLPIELIYFGGECLGNEAIIKWSTASEQNNNYFIVERSSDAIYFQPVGKVNGGGTSSTIHNYSFTDESPLNGISYYRLSQTDFDGNTEQFNSVIPVSCSGNHEFASSVYPNPASEYIYVLISGEANAQGTIRIYNTIGQVVLSKNIQLENDAIIALDISLLASANYILQINTGEHTTNQKICIVR